MEGDCELCGDHTTDLDCVYNDMGDEMYLCSECAQKVMLDPVTEWEWEWNV